MRHVLVTGGSRGIGATCTRLFRELGDQVTVWDAEPIGEAVECDIGDPESVRRAAADLDGPLHVVVNNAGIGGSGRPLDQTPLEEWDRILAVNLRGPWLVVRELLPKLADGACVVNVASTRALMSEPHTEPYAASKGGLVALTHSMAISLGPRVRVNCVSPGWIHTGGEAPSRVAHEFHPVGRVGTPDDVARAVEFLSRAENGFLTGANLVIDGGMTVKMIYTE